MSTDHPRQAESVIALRTLHERATQELNSIARRLLEAQRAQREAHDALLMSVEPEGEEPTIAFKQSWGVGAGRTYSYVAVKTADGYWYVTGTDMKAYVWLGLCKTYPAVARGEFWLCTEWTWLGPDDVNHGASHG